LLKVRVVHAASQDKLASFSSRCRLSLLQLACRHRLAAGRTLVDRLVRVSELQQHDRLRMDALAWVDPRVRLSSEASHAQKTSRVASRGLLRYHETLPLLTIMARGDLVADNNERRSREVGSV
jgi:hypothetical protein